MSDISELRRWLENEVDAGDEVVRVYADMARRIEEQLEVLRAALEKIANEDADEWDWPAVAREALNPAKERTDAS